MTSWRLTLSALSEAFAICRLSPDAPIPAWADHGPFVSVTRTHDELSIVCPQVNVPAEVRAERDWRCLKVEGSFALDGTIGVLLALAAPLAEAQVSIFAMSTFDTDYLLIQEKDLTRAIEALEWAGHRVEAEGSDGHTNAGAPRLENQGQKPVD
jgi:hypothetical protein